MGAATSRLDPVDSCVRRGTFLLHPSSAPHTLAVRTRTNRGITAKYGGTPFQQRSPCFALLHPKQNKTKQMQCRSTRHLVLYVRPSFSHLFSFALALSQTHDPITRSHRSCQRRERGDRDGTWRAPTYRRTRGALQRGRAAVQ